MIKEAEWQVDFYKREVQRAQDSLYTKKLALESLKHELEISLDVSQL